MKALVTGGSGFVGAALLERLRAQGVAVRALVRSAEARAVVEPLGAEPVRGDLLEEPGLERAMEGCDTVFHCAAKAATWGLESEFFAVNVRGTENVLRAARRAGVRRLVHASSLAVLVDGKPLRNVDEQRPYPPRWYGAHATSKGMAEQLVLDAASEALETVAVRLPILWGPGEKALLPSLTASTRRGELMWLGDAEHRVSVCHVRNAALGLELAAARGRSGAAYFVTDGAPPTLREFFTELLATQGLPPPRRSVPVAVALAAAWTMEQSWDVFHLHGVPGYDRLRVLCVGMEMTVDDARARRELHYAPEWTREEGLRELRQGPRV